MPLSLVPLFLILPALSVPALSAPVAVTLPAAAGSVSPALTPDGDGLLLSWWEPQGEGHALKLSRWDGETFSTVRTVASPKAAVVNWADSPAVSRAGDGALVAWWPQQAGDTPYAYEVALARSTDEGATWMALGPAHDDGTATEHGFVSMAPEGDGLRLAWLDGRAMAQDGPMQLRTALVGAGGGTTIGPSEAIDARTCDCCGTSMVATKTGPVLVYRDRSQDETRDIALTALGAQGWTHPSVVHADRWQVGGCPVNGPRATVSKDRLAVAWTTGGDGLRVRAAWSRTADPGRFDPAVELDARDPAGEPLGRVDLAPLDGSSPEGAVAVTWLRQESGLGKVQLASLASDGRRSPALTVGETTADRKSGFPRIGSTGDALLVVWTDPRQDASLQAVRLDRADLPALSGPAAAAPDFTASVDSKLSPRLPTGYRALDLSGQEHSLAFDPAGFTMVNFFASWCPPCMAELPVLADLVKRHPDLHLVSIATDDDPAKVKVLMAQKRISGLVLLDGASHITPVFGATELPTTLLYNAEGALVWSHEGPLSSDEPELDALLSGG